MRRTDVDLHIDSDEVIELRPIKEHSDFYTLTLKVRKGKYFTTKEITFFAQNREQLRILKGVTNG
jgi:hypothetical protein